MRRAHPRPVFRLARDPQYGAHLHRLARYVGKKAQPYRRGMLIRDDLGRLETSAVCPQKAGVEISAKYP